MGQNVVLLRREGVIARWLHIMQSLLLLSGVAVATASRQVLSNSTSWTNSTTGEVVKLTVILLKFRDTFYPLLSSPPPPLPPQGTNVVMKGAPWIPEVSGSDVCDSTDESGASTSCQTFNSADAEHIKSLGYVSCERS